MIRWQKYRTQKDTHVFGFGCRKKRKKIEKGRADGLKYGKIKSGFQCNPSTKNGLFEATILFVFFRLFSAIKKRTLASKADSSELAGRKFERRTCPEPLWFLLAVTRHFLRWRQKREWNLSKRVSFLEPILGPTMMNNFRNYRILNIPMTWSHFFWLPPS